MFSIALACASMNHGDLYADENPAAVNASEINIPNDLQTNPVESKQDAADTSPVRMDRLDDKHQLDIRDQVSFQILEDRAEPVHLLVTDLGELEIPYIGRFPAADKTCRQLAYELKAELEKEYYYQATVIVAIDILSSRNRVYLSGNVRIPGAQEVPPDNSLTLSRAILQAGGFAEFADQKHVQITRNQKDEGLPNEVIIVDVTEILEKGRVEKDVILKPDDLIYVPGRLISF